jgi:hypothetical protein
MIEYTQKPMLPDTLVRVRSLQEILSTLYQDGTLDALPFMPEMAKYCGMRFSISKRIERTCEESEKGMRRIQNVVFLDNLRCDGTAHGGCQKRCMIFWKEDWLTTQENDRILPGSPIDKDQMVADLPSEISEGQYICQSTELVKATTPLSLFDLMSYIRDLRSRTYSIPGLIKVLSYAFFLRLRYYLTGTPFRFLQGEQNQTPAGALNLRPGEWVQVRTKEEIRETLDANGMNRGLRYTLDMLPYCGKSYRVLSRLEKMIHEPTRRLVELKDTVILDDSVCRGCHIIKGGCPRENYNFWREIWLRRNPPA